MIGWDDKDVWMGENHQPVPFFVLSQVTLSYFSGTNMNDLRKTSLHPCGYKDVPKWVRVYLDVHRSQWILTTEACSPEAWNTGERRFFPGLISGQWIVQQMLIFHMELRKACSYIVPKEWPFWKTSQMAGCKSRTLKVDQSKPWMILDDFGPTKKCWFVKILLKSPCLLAMPIPSGNLT